MSALDNLPTGYPLASKPEDTSSQVRAKSGRIVAPNTKAASHPGPHTGNRISHRQLRDIAASLSARDMEVLASVDRYRFLTAGHLRVFHFTAHQTAASAARTCRRVLARLRSLRILGVLKRRVGGVRSGSEGMVYFVDAAGDRILREQQVGRPRWRPEEPSARFVDHTLAIADLAVALLQEADVHGAEVVRLAPEHEASRRYTDLLGAPQTLRPDLYIELAEHPGDEDVEAFFIEVDLGHESLPTLLSKCAAYEAYRAAGVEQRAYGSYPKVVWAMDAARPETALRRQESLASTLERSPQFPRGAYVVTPLGETAVRLMEGYGHG